MLHVTCAIIEREGMVLAAQRSSTMPLSGKWEFPGGKQEPGETLEDCMIREIKEELHVNICILSSLPPSIYVKKKGKSICLYPFICQITDGEVRLKEHAQIQWLIPAELPGLDWAEADVAVVKEYLNQRN